MVGLTLMNTWGIQEWSIKLHALGLLNGCDLETICPSLSIHLIDTSKNLKPKGSWTKSKWCVKTNPN